MLTKVVVGSGVFLQDKKERPVFGFFIASRISPRLQELLNSRKSFWSCSRERKKVSEEKDRGGVISKLPQCDRV